MQTHSNALDQAGIMSNISINLQVLAVLALQSSVQGRFLACYFQSGFKGFLIYTCFFLFVLYPLDMLIPFDWIIFKNLLNFAGLFLLSMFLNRALAMRRLVLAIILYWLPLPLCEVPVHVLIWLFGLEPVFDSSSISLFGQTQTVTFFMQLLATLILAVLYDLILKKTRAASLNQSIVLYLTSLLASLGALAFLCLCFVYPQSGNTSCLQYLLAVGLLAAFNIWFVVSICRYVKKQTAVQADLIIRREYRRQMQMVLKPDLSREELRRIRHDLINALEHEQLRDQDKGHKRAF